MRIIKKHEYEEPEYKLTCGKCYTQFAYVQADIKHDLRNGQYVVCPSCGKPITHTTAADYYNK